MLQIDEMDPSQSINDLFQPLYQRASNIYTFVALRNQADEISRDYGTGELSNMTEAHLVIDICDHEGATVTELAEMSCRTKSAISQIIAKIEKRAISPANAAKAITGCTTSIPPKRGCASAANTRFTMYR